METQEKSKQVYAIGMKGWVEIREAIKRPKAVISEVETEGKDYETRLVYDPSIGYHDYQSVEIKKPLTIRVVYFKGGRVLFRMHENTFRRVVGKLPKIGFAIRLSADLAAAVKTVGAHTYGKA